MLSRNVEQRKITGLKLNTRCPILTHILFSDDTNIFGKADRKEADAIGVVIGQYCRLSGLSIDREKSAILFSSNTPTERKEKIAAKFEVDLSISMGNYLGLPAEWGRSKVETFNYMIERLTTRAEGWKSVLLSAGGREVMAKTILQAIQSYLFQFSCCQTSF
ncbi:hypothetical protein LINPERHAP2_LOCUS36265 [Linum perenne]